MSLPDLYSSGSENVLMEEDCHSAWELIGIAQGGERLPAIRVDEKPLVIGRHAASDFVLADPTVSQSHAEVFAVGPLLFLRDMNSTNGTFVNGIKVRGRTQLGDGDQIVIGTFMIQVHAKSQDTVATTNRNEPTIVSLDHWLQNTLEELIQGQGLFIVFQPIKTVQAEKLVGFEALVRSKIVGLESPDELFRLVSKFQKSKQLSDTCRMMAAAEAKLLPANIEIFLNTSSAESLDDELIAALKKLRDKYPALKFVIEVHEDSLTETAKLGKFQEHLHALDMGLAFDDFGVGKSRLQDLLHVRPDYVKFDKALLLESILVEPQQQAWVRSLVQSVHDLGIRTIAEGIESHAVMKLCGEIGFDLCQGYAIGKPAPVKEWLT